MTAISIIILLALLFYLFYFSERMKRIREIVARPIIGLTIIAIASVLFLVADYNGRYYGSVRKAGCNPCYNRVKTLSLPHEAMASITNRIP
ncbi:hypothetical protein [Marseilla massiliensis]|uniref:hypothetical protein n=1 Tax=Marseilla massiliensis TaxID=1841864 RepID=UPI0030C86967